MKQVQILNLIYHFNNFQATIAKMKNMMAVCKPLTKGYGELKGVDRGIHPT